MQERTGGLVFQHSRLAYCKCVSLDPRIDDMARYILNLICSLSPKVALSQSSYIGSTALRYYLPGTLLMPSSLVRSLYAADHDA